MRKTSFVLSLSLIFALNACTTIGDQLTKHKTEADSAALSVDNNPMGDNENALETETINGKHYIAIAAPLTGAYRGLGRNVLEGATLAVEEFNSKEKADNKIGTIIVDDGGLVAEALGKADVVIAQEALGVIGHLNSTISMEASKKYATAGIPMISPASTHPRLTERPQFKGYIFRTIGTDRQIAETAANYVLSKPRFNKVAVLYNDQPYGISVATEFVRNLAKDTSKELVFYETIPVRTTDHTETANKVAEKEPDLALFVGEYNDAGYLVQELKKKLPALQFLGVEGVHNQEFIKIAADSAEGTIIVGLRSLPEKLQKKYIAKYQHEGTSFVKSSYDATKLLLESIKSNNFSSDSKAVAKTVAENTIFDPNGDLINPNFVLYKVEGAKFVPLNE